MQILGGARCLFARVLRPRQSRQSPTWGMARGGHARGAGRGIGITSARTVSYTHLTLPTICSV
eukprot:3213079-Alexandrium_andersonii.AAC.1